MLGGSLNSQTCYTGWRLFFSIVCKWTDGCKLTWSLLDIYIWHILRNISVGKMDWCKLTWSLLDIYIWETTPSENKWVKIKTGIICICLCTKYSRVQSVMYKKIFVCTKYFTWYFKNLFFYAWIPLRISGSTPFKTWGIQRVEQTKSNHNRTNTINKRSIICYNR